MIMLRFTLMSCPVCLTVSLVIAARLLVGWLKAEVTILFPIECPTLAILLGCLLIRIITRRILGPPAATVPVTCRSITAPLVPGGEMTSLCRFPLTGVIRLTTWAATPRSLFLRCSCVRGHSGASPLKLPCLCDPLGLRLPIPLTWISGPHPR